MDKLIEDFKESLFENSEELVGDYTELGIDSFINDGVLKDIPIVKTIVSVLKIGKNVHDRNLLKQSLNFIKEFNNGNIDEEKLQNYKIEIEKNTKKCEKELERVLLLLNNFIDVQKSIILAKLFRAYINEQINWNEFCEFSDITDRLFMEDIRILKHFKENKELKGQWEDQFRVERIYSLGILGVELDNVSYEEMKEDATAGRSLNILGQKYCNIIF